MQHSEPERTNEELVILIQDGHAELYEELWKNVERFTLQQANRFHRLTERIVGIDVDDYMQEAIFALYDAVKAFDRDGEYKFLSYYKNHLLTAFVKCCGLRTKRTKNDPIQEHGSIDAPLPNQTDGAPTTLAELLPDESAEAAFDSAECDIWNEELRQALENALELLPEKERTVVRGKFLEGRPLDELAKEIGVSENRVYAISREGAARMRKQSHRSGLYDFWYGLNPYRYTSLSHFLRTGQSSQETILEIKERREAARRANRHELGK